MGKFLFILAIIVAGFGSAFAGALAIEDINGNWCLANGNTNVFTQAQLTVLFPNGSKRVLKIEKIKVEGDRLNIYWSRESTIAAGKKYYEGGNYTSYKLSADKRTLVQLQTEGGDNGPRYELKRC